MSVTLYFGKTEHGKTVRAVEDSKEFGRVVFYDNAHCIEDGIIITDFSPRNFSKIFQEWVYKPEFRLIFRAPLKMDEQEGARRVAHLLYSGWGMFWKEKYKNIPNEARINFFVDEAEKVSSKEKNDIFRLTVTKGRHLFIDTHAITQIPGDLPRYYKAMATKIIVFNSEADEWLTKKFKKHAHLLEDLPKYQYIVKKDNGEYKHFNEKGKVIRSWT